METSVFSDFFRVISDGEKMVILRECGQRRECYLLTNPLLTTFNMRVDWPSTRYRSFDGSEKRISGIAEFNLDLSFRGGEIRNIDHPLVMGVDIFDRLSITDYLDIINEKIKGR